MRKINKRANEFFLIHSQNPFPKVLAVCLNHPLFCLRSKYNNYSGSWQWVFSKNWKVYYTFLKVCYTFFRMSYFRALLTIYQLCTFHKNLTGLMMKSVINWRIPCIFKQYNNAQKQDCCKFDKKLSTIYQHFINNLKNLLTIYQQSINFGTSELWNFWTSVTIGVMLVTTGDDGPSPSITPKFPVFEQESTFLPPKETRVMKWWVISIRKKVEIYFW